MSACGSRQVAASTGPAANATSLFDQESIERRPRWTGAEQAKDVSAVLAPIREFIVHIPTPSSHHCENQTPTFLEQNLIHFRIVRADLFGYVGNIEFNRPDATGFEVDEHRTTRGAEQVSSMRFSVQQLFGGDALSNCLTRTVERA
jgi:hypothetical protein